MSENKLATQSDAAAIENVLISGDLSKLTPEQRVSYYMQLCKSLNLNVYTRPFDYITLSGKLTLYAKKDATDQIRKNNGVSITGLEDKTIGGVYIVTAHAQSSDGRQDVSTGAVFTETLRGEQLANAMMKAETKAKRRVTLSICGLGMLDETEVETIPTAKPVVVAETGEIVEAKAVEVLTQSALDNPFIPAALVHLSGICSEDGTPYPLIPTDKLSFMHNSLVKALKDNNLEPEVKREKTIKRDAAQEIMTWRKSNPAA